MKLGALTATRAGPSVVLATQGARLILGAGEGTAWALSGDPHDVIGLVLPGSHPGACGGLISLLHHLAGRTRPLTIVWPLGDEALAGLIDATTRAQGGRLPWTAASEGLPFRLTVGPFQVRLAGGRSPLAHPSVRVQADGVTVAWTADPADPAAFAADARTADLAIGPVDDPAIAASLATARAALGTPRARPGPPAD